MRHERNNGLIGNQLNRNRHARQQLKSGSENLVLAGNMTKRLPQGVLDDFSFDLNYATNAVDLIMIRMLQQPQPFLLRRKSISLDDFLLHFVSSERLLESVEKSLICKTSP
jgi:hypothetical protein